MKCQNCHTVVDENHLEDFEHFDLEPVPPVDWFNKCQEKALLADMYALGIYECPECGLIQVKKTPPKEIFYDNYIYTSSSSPDMSSNFESLVSVIGELVDLENKDLKILDIGCNDGLLLSKFKSSRNIQLFGCDPSPVARESCKGGYRLFSEYFPGPLTREAGLYDVIIGTNSLAHIPNIGNCFHEIAALLSSGGMLVMEVSDFKDMSSLGAWDYIYHEHLYYYTEESLSCILRSHGFEVLRVDKISTKGGSLRVFATKDMSVKKEKKREDGQAKEIRELRKCYETALRSYRHLSEYIEKKNVRLLGYGACATSSVTIAQHALFRRVTAIIDDNRDRQGLFAPNSGIPIVALESIEFNENDVVIVFAWRFIEPIRDKLKAICSRNGWPMPLVVDAVHIGHQFNKC